MARIEKSIDVMAPPEKLWHVVFWNRVPEYVDVMTKAEYTKGKHITHKIYMLNSKLSSIGKHETKLRIWNICNFTYKQTSVSY